MNLNRMYTLSSCQPNLAMGSLDLLELPSRQEQRKNSSSSLKIRGSVELPTINEHEETTGLDQVKTVTSRLQLSTRRASILEWKENVKQTLMSPTRHTDDSCGDDEDVVLGLIPGEYHCRHGEIKTEKERREHIDSALEWLRSELKAMKTQDHVLAMQLMRLRADIQKIKLQKTSSEHQDLIDNSAYSVEEESELKSLPFHSSLLMPTLNNNMQDIEYMSIVDKPLKDMGVTRMNLNNRRFSLR